MNWIMAVAAAAARGRPQPPSFPQSLSLPHPPLLVMAVLLLPVESDGLRLAMGLGRVFTCGGSDCGKLGMGDEAQRFLPAQVVESQAWV